MEPDGTVMDIEPADPVTVDAPHYSPPWADVSIIGIAGSSGSGKSTLAHAIVQKLNLPWVVILSMDSFYKSLDAEASARAFRNEYDFDSPEALDFDILIQRLQDLKAGKRAEIPVYSFEKHARVEKTTTLYSPHVLVLEGIFALYDPRVLALLDMKIFCEAEPDLCLSRRILRDVQDRGREIEGVIKQWFAWVKPNFEKYVDPQRKVADIILPRGIKNRVAMEMVTQFIERKLLEKSHHHRARLTQLEAGADSEPLSHKVIIMEETPQLRGINTIIHNNNTSRADFIFYFDRFAALLIEQALGSFSFEPATVTTPLGLAYRGLRARGQVSAVVLLRGGAALEASLRSVIPDCKAGRVLIQSNGGTGEPELHFLALPRDLDRHDGVLLLAAQMDGGSGTGSGSSNHRSSVGGRGGSSSSGSGSGSSCGGAELMAVQVLVDHGVRADRIVVAAYAAGRRGLHRLTRVFPDVTVVVGNVVEDVEERWLEKRYFGC